MFGNTINSLEQVPQLSKQERENKMLSILRFCNEAGILSSNGFFQCYGKPIDWTAIPGGLYWIPGYNQDQFNGRLSLKMPSFLLAKHPVTNGQFLDFLLSAAGTGFRPFVYRRTTGNHAYLFSWNAVFEKFGLEITDWRKDDVVSKFPGWIDWPVVSVDWLAAKSFAYWLNCDLPSESHYEAASRMLLSDEKFENAIHNYPWEESTPIGYCLFVGQDDSRSIVFPRWPADLANVEGWPKEAISNFLRWRDDQAYPDHVPVSLIDGVREWTSEIWKKTWPLKARDNQLLEMDVNPIDLAPEQRKVDERTESRPIRERVFAVRGGSFGAGSSECRISMRNPQKQSYCDSDRGFRCMKRIIF